MVIPRIMAYYPKSQKDRAIKIRMSYRAEDMLERWVNSGFRRSSIRPMQQIKGTIFKTIA